MDKNSAGQYPSKNTGLTLVELVATLAIAAISLHFATASAKSLLTSNRLTSQTNLILSSLYTTRSEATKLNQRVTMRKRGEQWEEGWIIFSDRNGNALFDEGEVLIQHQAPLSSNFTLRGNRMIKDYVSYTGTGLARRTSGALQPGTLMLCDASADSDEFHARAIIIGTSGRPRISKYEKDMKTCIPTS